jgi:ubiquinone biosynthesis protein
MRAGQKRPEAQRSAVAVPREALRLAHAWVRHGVFGMPARLAMSFIREPAFDGPMSESRFFDAFGENALRLFDDLGPIYGKAGQIVLSRLSPPMQAIAETLRFTRLYKDWPPLGRQEIEAILDREIPAWRAELKVEPSPLGVASIAQVHAAVDREGREWVIKVIKPKARIRLTESVEALEQLIGMFEPLAVTLTTKRLIREMRELCAGFRRELSLSGERETIERVREKLKSRRQKLLVIPVVHPTLNSDTVLTIERFRGTSMAAIVAGKQPLPASVRQKLARTMLQELLVQVFELGLFHADPHAGNLILMDDGNVGLFDWGLSGELLESDRRHIASILKAVIALDMEQLIDALIVMGEEDGRTLTRPEVKKELGAVIALVKKGRTDPTKKPSLQQLFEACLKGASRLGIHVPEGLMMMAKSLITIEGLAKGIDPSVSLARVATPVLWRAARPGLKDLMNMGKRLPQLAKQLWSQQ